MALSIYKLPISTAHSRLTHPDIAKTLVDPLFATRKEGVSDINKHNILLNPPLYAKGEEREVQRSADRVSKIYERKTSSLINRTPNGA
jgi:hypothetical protein